jgi:mRNA interferase RelE/StbE
LHDYRIFETAEFIKKLDKLSQLDKSFIQNKLKIYVYPQIKNTHWFEKISKNLTDLIRKLGVIE